MKYLGYLFKAILWFLGLAMSFWLGFFKSFLSIFIPDSWKSEPSVAAGGGSYSFGDELRFTLRNGILDSYNAGSQFRIDNQCWVYEMGMAGQRVGRIDEDGLWRSESNKVIGRFDEDGVLRKPGDGLLDGVLGGQEGTGEELGRLD